ncbi:FUSC family protein [bacterium]|nr:FUSC family protein [bacterium]
MKGAGGTPGGIKPFILGAIMAVIGGYLLLHQVQVHSGFWRLFSYGNFGIALLPFLFGIGLLFFNGKSIPGWILTVAGLLIIFTGIIANLEIYFLPTSLFNTLIMLVLLVGGIALIFRSLQSVE